MIDMGITGTDRSSGECCAVANEFTMIINKKSMYMSVRC